MTLDIGRAVEAGFRKTATKLGTTLAGLLFAWMVVYAGAMYTVLTGVLPELVLPAEQIGSVESELPYTLPVSAEVAGGIATVMLLLAPALYVAIYRGMVRDDLDTVPTEIFTRRIGWAWLSALLASIITGILVLVGLFMLVVPGIFLAVSFVFFYFFVAVEDDGPVDAIVGSWNLAAGNRWRIFGLLVVTFALSLAVSISVSIVSMIDPLVGDLLNSAIVSVVTVIVVGIFADAYLQLRHGDYGGTGVDRSSGPDDQNGADSFAGSTPTGDSGRDGDGPESFGLAANVRADEGWDTRSDHNE